MSEKEIKETRKEISFFQFLDRVELPLVIFFQKIFKTPKTYKLIRILALLGCDGILHLFCLSLYALGYYDKTQTLAKSMIIYVFLTHFKKFLYRKRPNEFPQVFCIKKSGSGSFPSRHSARATLASFVVLGPRYHLIYVSIVIFSRIVGGQHYLLDCIAGYLIGLLSIYISRFLEDPFLLFTLSAFAFLLCKKAAASLSILPFFVAPKVKQSYFSLLFLILEIIFVKIIRSFVKQSHPYKAIIGILMSSSYIYCITHFVPYIENIFSTSTVV